MVRRVFRKRLLETIAICDTSQTKVADELGITRQSIGSYMSGKTTPSLDTFVKLVKYFNDKYGLEYTYNDWLDRDVYDENATLSELDLSPLAIEKILNFINKEEKIK